MAFNPLGPLNAELSSFTQILVTHQSGYLSIVILGGAQILLKFTKSFVYYHGQRMPCTRKPSRRATSSLDAFHAYSTAMIIPSNIITTPTKY
jgi:hypothetical protein